MPDFTLTHLLMIAVVLAVALACFRFRGRGKGGGESRRAAGLLGVAASGKRIEPTLGA